MSEIKVGQTWRHKADPQSSRITHTVVKIHPTGDPVMRRRGDDDPYDWCAAPEYLRASYVLSRCEHSAPPADCATCKPVTGEELSAGAVDLVADERGNRHWVSIPYTKAGPRPFDAHREMREMLGGIHDYAEPRLQAQIHALLEKVDAAAVLPSRCANCGAAETKRLSASVDYACGTTQYKEGGFQRTVMCNASADCRKMPAEYAALRADAEKWRAQEREKRERTAEQASAQDEYRGELHMTPADLCGENYDAQASNADARAFGGLTWMFANGQTKAAEALIVQARERARTETLHRLYERRKATREALCRPLTAEQEREREELKR